MSWNFLRDSALKRHLSFQYGRSGSQNSSTNIFFDTDHDYLLSADDSTSAEEDFDSFVLFGQFRGNVVGLRYYTGVLCVTKEYIEGELPENCGNINKPGMPKKLEVNNNEMVALQREPHNPYDRNAVKVNNVNGEQVGHIKKELAAALTQIMDRKLAKVEGIVPYGAQNAFTMPVNLSFWGREENKEVVLNHMKKYGFKLGPLPKGSQGYEASFFSRGAGPSYKAPALSAVQLTTEQGVEPLLVGRAEGFLEKLLPLKSEFDKLFEDLKEDDKTRELEPAQAVETPLLPHQKQALAWMVSRENSKELPPFWEHRSNFFYNTLTNFAERERPNSIKGGILADDMGLGKTLSVIALILTNFCDGKPHPTGHRNSDMMKQECSSKEKMLLHRKSKLSRKQASSQANEGSESASSCQAKTEARPKRQKARKVLYTLTDSEEEDWIPQKVKATEKSSLMEDDHFAMALTGICTAAAKKKGKKKATVTSSSHIPTISKLQKCARSTLIICPLSVLSNWIDQFEQHVKTDANLNIYIYYGTERNKDPDMLSKHDVVLTTYSVVTHDYGSDSPLHKISWLRVVLDEGHTIRNPNAQQTKAVHSLDSERRWVLTGTPIQNSLKDLWSIISFLKLKPFTDMQWWHRTIQRPVTMGDQGGLRRLQALVKSITLRRTKTTKVNGKPVLQLPERKVYIQHIKLSPEERNLYESVKNEGKTIIGGYFNEGTVLTHYADVLAVLVRLRQLCCHPHLVSGSLSSMSQTASSTPEELREKLVSKIKLVLSSGSDEECSICLDSLNIPVITYCAHVFCKPCICQVIHKEQPNAKCPLCRGELRLEHLLECPEEEAEPSESQKNVHKWMPSSKISALMHALTEQRTKDPHVKSLVVSQFTSFLSLIETALRETLCNLRILQWITSRKMSPLQQGKLCATKELIEGLLPENCAHVNKPESGFTFTRLDGSKSQKKRTEAIQSFQSSHVESPSVMLLSLKAGGVGLNLTAASRVFLMDPAWNPAAEEQCFDRCYRLGQTKEVIITKFVVKDSVEENMLKIQNRKKELAAGAFGGNKPTSADIKRARINEIRTLVDL